MAALAIALQLIVLHQIDGYAIAINPAHIVALRQPTREANRLLVGGGHCVIAFVNGKYFLVLETCPQVQKLLEGATR